MVYKSNLVERLIQCFIPVRIGVVQSSLLLNRWQGEKESANDYAQKLKSNVFYKANHAGHNRFGEYQ